MGEVEAQKVWADVDAEERLVHVDLDVRCLLPLPENFNSSAVIVGVKTGGRLTLTDGQYILMITDLSV